MSASSFSRLWSHACSALSRLRAALLPLDTLVAKELRALRADLSALELFCRRLALSEALVLDRVAPGSHFRPPGGRMKARAPRPRRPCLRLWPHPKPAAARITMLGPPTSLRQIWAAERRAALIARLKLARRKPQRIRLADRIDALQRFLDAPRAAIRRLARKIRALPNRALRLAGKLAGLRSPASSVLAPAEVVASGEALWARVRDTS